jgi:hypothetical protein
MSKLRALSSSLLLLVAAFLLACGTSQRQLQSVSISPATAKRQLQSVSISPPAASGQAQFVATGFYSDGSQVTPLPALWFPIRPWYNAANPVNFFNLDDTGKASCIGSGGSPAAFAVFATAPSDPNFPLSQMDEFTPQVSGAAQLSCP